MVTIFILFRNNKTEMDFDDPFKLKNKISSVKSNPKPPRSVNDESSVYIAIFDEEYEEKVYHEYVYKQWISKLRQNPRIDGVELYSLVKWSSPSFDLSTIVVQNPPHFMSDPRAWQLYHILKLYMERSLSKWLFLIGDAAYINHDNFEKFITDEVLLSYDPNSIMFKGSCVEPRYFFQELQISSGVLLSRETVRNIIDLDKFWNHTFEIELNPDDALGQSFCQLNACADLGIKNGFIGGGFNSDRDYNVLLSGDDSKLPPCIVADNLKNPPAGIAGNCVKFEQRFSEFISWAGAKKNLKTQFLKNAELMVRHIKPEYGIVWDRMNPILCKL